MTETIWPHVLAVLTLSEGRDPRARLILTSSLDSTRRSPSIRRLSYYGRIVGELGQIVGYFA